MAKVRPKISRFWQKIDFHRVSDFFWAINSYEGVGFMQKYLHIFNVTISILVNISRFFCITLGRCRRLFATYTGELIRACVRNLKSGGCYNEMLQCCNCQLTSVTQKNVPSAVVYYSVDSIKRTVHLAFHGLFSLLKILFTISKQYF